MEITPTEIPEVRIIQPKVFGDARGWFCETFQAQRYREALGIDDSFVQDNMSRSAQGILRGLHMQNPHTQGKLVWVVEGTVFDVAVDARIGSPTFGRWVGCELSAENKRQLWIPQGFLHGFCVTSDSAIFVYKCTDYYDPQNEVGAIWNDPDLGIDWPISEPLVSNKDGALPRLAEIPKEKLLAYR